MKLKIENYYSNNNIKITDEGWIDLQNFCKAILYKRIGSKYDVSDLITISMLACVDKLQEYDPKKNNELGGFLYWTVLGEISKNSYRVKKEIPMGLSFINNKTIEEL